MWNSKEKLPTTEERLANLEKLALENTRVHSNEVHNCVSMWLMTDYAEHYVKTNGDLIEIWNDCLKKHTVKEQQRSENYSWDDN